MLWQLRSDFKKPPTSLGLWLAEGPFELGSAPPLLYPIRANDGLGGCPFVVSIAPEE